MAKSKSKLNDKSEEYLKENIFQQNPEGLPECDAPGGVDGDKIVVVNRLPEMRRVQFLNGRDPGVALMFHYHTKTHPLKHYTLLHGKEYDLPIEVINHLENCYETIHGYRAGADGHPEMYAKSKRYIFSCREARKQ